MNGIWLEEQKLSLRTTLPIPEPKPGEALIRLVQAGICNTDLELCRGYYPSYNGILGHEFVGIVEKVVNDDNDNSGQEHEHEHEHEQEPEQSQLQSNNNMNSWIGKRVCGDINASCGTCDYCTGISTNTTTTSTDSRKMPSHCKNRTVLGIVNRNGCFANYLCLPVSNLYIVPECVSNDAATFVEPLAAALEIQEQIKISSSQKVIVIGDGKLGQLVAMATKVTTNCTVVTIGKHIEKLQNLHKYGIISLLASDLDGSCTTTSTSTVTSQQQDAIDLLGSYDIAIECTGNPHGFTTALSALRPRGTLVLKSTYAGALSIDASIVVVNEITIIGSRCGPFQKAIDLLEKSASTGFSTCTDGTSSSTNSTSIDVTSLIHGRYSLRDAIKAFEHAQQKGTMKILLHE